MRWCLALLVCCFLAAVNALSSSGSRLLVVLDESTEKSAYSTLWSDLEGNWTLNLSFRINLTCQLGRGYDVSFESPKSDKLSLFQHGERAYDHLLILPPKSKGRHPALRRVPKPIG
jgi:oligosaccharyltransferase complex subunit beta